MSKLFKPMRSVEPSVDHPIRYPMLGSPKYDGIRCCKYQGKALTKSGKPVPNHHIRNWIEANVPDGFDGELISGSPTLETCYSTTFSAVMTQAGEPDFSFYAFDVCDNLEMRARERKIYVKALCMVQDVRVIFAEQEVINSDAELEAYYSKCLILGYEGVVLVNPMGLYKYGKSTAKEQTQLKLKPHADYEGKILETFEAMHNDNEAFSNEVGETKRSTHAENKTPAGRVGGYLVEDVTTKAIFKVGAGRMKHLEATEEWLAHLANPMRRIGSYLKYRSMSYGTMTNGAARHGRWIGWRDVADMTPEDLEGKV